MKNLLIVLVFSFFFNCSKKSNAQTELQKKDVQISNIYKKFYENRHDYGDQINDGRDSILRRFKKTLLNTLANSESATFPFDSLSNTIKIIASKDKKLRIFSWDELNGGTWHIYNSAYQYNESNKSYSGSLKLKDDNSLNPLSTDVTHFEIENIESNKYLVKGYGTHGSGKEFFVYRLLSFSNGEITDCYRCFNGEDKLIFVRPRSTKLELDYDSKTREITYPEMIPAYRDGEDTGFTEPSGKIVKLKYENGAFVKSNQ